MKKRGTHTTVIEQAEDVCAFLLKQKVSYSPGRIEVISRAKSDTIKIKMINEELYEMVVTSGSAKQTFKLFSKETVSAIKKAKKDKVFARWNVRFGEV